MNRLTKEEILKFPKTTYGRALGKTIASKVMNDLLQYKDLEEQLGCPLDVVVKALQNGVYYEDVANCMRYMVVDLHFNLDGDFVLSFDYDERLLARNYKKTWWLKKDKSE